MSQQSAETEGSDNISMTSTPHELNNKKRSRDSETGNSREAGAGAELEPLNKKNSASGSSQTSYSDIEDKTSHSNDSDMDSSVHHKNDLSSEEEVPEGSEDTGKSKTNEVNHPITSPFPSMGPTQWEQIMLRFDSFEKSIQSTIKEEIKVNNQGLQTQVKSLSTKVLKVESNISANKNEIAKINQKVASIGNIQEYIASEVEKQVSTKVSDLDKQVSTSF